MDKFAEINEVVTVCRRLYDELGFAERDLSSDVAHWSRRIEDLERFFTLAVERAKGREQRDAIALLIIGTCLTRMREEINRLLALENEDHLDRMSEEYLIPVLTSHRRFVDSLDTLEFSFSYSE